MKFRRNLKKYYAPKRWKLGGIFSKIAGINLLLIKKDMSKRYKTTLRIKKEIEQLKKHIIFLEELIDSIQKEEDKNE